jgi:hypothetical protein
MVTQETTSAPCCPISVPSPCAERRDLLRCAGLPAESNVVPASISVVFVGRIADAQDDAVSGRQHVLVPLGGFGAAEAGILSGKVFLRHAGDVRFRRVNLMV